MVTVKVTVKATGRRYFTNSVPQRDDSVEVGGLESASFTARNCNIYTEFVIKNTGTTMTSKIN